MNGKWSTIILVALFALASSTFFYISASHESRIAALEKILMGESGMGSRGSERE